MTRKGVFQATTLETTKPVMGVDSEVVVDNTILTTGDTITQPRAQATKEQTSKDRNRCRYTPWFTCCRLSQNNKKLSSYSQFKYNTALNKEGYSDIVTFLQAGRIKAFKDNWAVLTQDPWVLQTVQGFKLPLVAQPVQTIVPPQMMFPSDQQLLISSEVESLLRKQVITAVQPSQGNVISHIFVVPKKMGATAQ